jgi:hypothetical protein
MTETSRARWKFMLELGNEDAIYLQNSSQRYKSITLQEKVHETPPEHEFLNF